MPLYDDSFSPNCQIASAGSWSFFGCGSVAVCPHDRPVRKRTSKKALTKVFDARQPIIIQESSLPAVSFDRMNEREKTLFKFALPVNIKDLNRE